MNIVFVGTPEFAVPSLNSLAKSTHKILAVITQPDKPKGRSKILSSSAIKEAALALGLKIIQPVNINHEDTVKQLQALSPDCIVVVAFGQFLSQAVLRIPRNQCINIHASLLPKYRGAAPANHAIIQGETKTGVTAIVMVNKMDAGDIIAQKETPIFPDETAGELEKRLASLSADLLPEILDLLEAEKVTYTKQDESKVSFAPKLTKEDGLIIWHQETQKIHNRIRGVTPTPGAYTYYMKGNTREKQRILLRKTQIHHDSAVKTAQNPGAVIEVAQCGIHVVTGDSFICITRLQPEGGRAMDVSEYLRGHKISVQDMFVSG